MILIEDLAQILRLNYIRSRARNDFLYICVQSKSCVEYFFEYYSIRLRDIDACEHRLEKSNGFSSSSRVHAREGHTQDV